MRVLHLTTEFPPIIYGGLGTAIGGLVKASANAGIDVGVLLFGPPRGVAYGQPAYAANAGWSAADPGMHGVSLFEVPFFQDEGALMEVARHIRPDILHLHSFWLWPYAKAVRDHLGVPLVYTVHSLDRAEYELGHGPPECVVQWVQQDAVIQGADRVIALTRSEQVLIDEYCPGVRDRIRVVGNGIEDIPIRRTGRPRTADPTVLFSGRFVERKGVHELIEAIRIVQASSPRVRFVLAGGHRHCTGAEMAAWLLPPGLRGHRAAIHFTGWLTPEQMAIHYEEADILVVPSWYEPFGMVVLEGMLHGLAVAASEIGGPAEILQHKRNGYLFAPRNANALAASILTLADDPGERTRVALAGARDVRAKWLWPQIILQMLNVYGELAAP